jgi:TPR repeat protein
MSKNNNDTAVDTAVDDITNGIDKVDISKDDVADTCANCGKGGASNTCNKCKQVKYCNAACKKKHKTKHKKDCEEHLKRAAESYDEKLFKQPPSEEDCPICFQRLPFLYSGSRYKSCCGKIICSGCIHAPLYDDQGNKVDNTKCPFCRTSTPRSIEEALGRDKKRMETGDAIAMYNMGNQYREGIHTFTQDHEKALELFHRAADLGYAKAYNGIGVAYYNGAGVEVDKEKAKHYYELAAMKGCVYSRHNLGVMEGKAGNMDRSLKHYMIVVEGGHNDSLNSIQEFYLHGYVSKEFYTKALRSYQKYLVDIRSAQRDEAAAAREDYKYIE